MNFNRSGFCFFRGCFCSLQRVQLVILDQKTYNRGKPTRLNNVESKLFRSLLGILIIACLFQWHKISCFSRLCLKVLMLKQFLQKNDYRCVIECFCTCVWNPWYLWLGHSDAFVHRSVVVRRDWTRTVSYWSYERGSVFCRDAYKK